jgi:hypothetical protein
MVPRARRPSPALVISLIALFVSLGGTGYAAIKITGKNVKNGSLTGKDIKNSSLAGGDVRNHSLGTKDFKAGDLPAGATGATGGRGVTGSRGATGAAGTARAYAHISHGALVTADGKGISGMVLGCVSNTSCTAPPADGSPAQSTSSYCFKLGFAPKNAQVTPDGGQSNGDATLEATNWAAHMPGRDVAPSHAGCPPGYQSTEIEIYTTASSSPVTGFYVTFE